MYFLYLKSNGEIIPSVRKGIPSQRTLSKALNCDLGSGIKWQNVDMFYAEDKEFSDDFVRTAPLGKYYVDNDEVEENFDWVEPEEEEWE